jgi:hypothetical protein
MAGIGALTGAAISRGRRLAREQLRKIAENWSLTAGVIGVAPRATALVMRAR